MTNQVKEILEWFKLAVPEPTDRTFWVQAGCDAEEYAEQLDAMGWGYYADEVSCLADQLKNDPDDYDIEVVDKKELLDALCDKIVTSIGLAHMLGMDIEGALAEVNRSNWSKFESGKPLFNEQGKIKKGAGYTPPQLEQFIPNEGE